MEQQLKDFFNEICFLIKNNDIQGYIKLLFLININHTDFNGKFDLEIFSFLNFLINENILTPENNCFDNKNCNNELLYNLNDFILHHRLKV